MSHVAVTHLAVRPLSATHGERAGQLLRAVLAGNAKSNHETARATQGHSHPQMRPIDLPLGRSAERGWPARAATRGLQTGGSRWLPHDTTEVGARCGVHHNIADGTFDADPSWSTDVTSADDGQDLPARHVDVVISMRCDLLLDLVHGRGQRLVLQHIGDPT